MNNGHHEVLEGNGQEFVAETYMLIWRAAEHVLCLLGVSGTDRDWMVEDPEAEVDRWRKFGEGMKAATYCEFASGT
jgi:hypothetical protein